MSDKLQFVVAHAFAQVEGDKLKFVGHSFDN